MKKSTKNVIILVLLAIICCSWGIDPINRKATKTEQLYKTWNASHIPYSINHGTPTFAVRKIEMSLETLMENTCLVFTKRSNEKQFIGFRYRKNRGSCFISRIGMDTYGATNISLSSRCLAVDSILHYVFHALGFYHEQNRPDAGQYLKVNADSMKKEIWNGAIIRLLPYHENKIRGSKELSLNMVGPFDYKSIMLQDDLATARKNARTPVLINIQNRDMQVGGLNGPTEMDYLKTSAYFKCKGIKIKRGTKPGQWGPWGEWTPKYCPVRCGIGYQQRFRWCNKVDGAQCLGLSTQTRQCDDCAGDKCRNLGGDRFCQAFANCNREYHVMYCRKFCRYCGHDITNNKSDYYCFRFARQHCNEAWAQKDCTVTCPKAKKHEIKHGKSH